MEPKRYWSTNTPTDKQIRRRANFEYWKFRCPICDEGCTGYHEGDMSGWYEARAKGNYDYPFTNVVRCFCGWEWKDPKYFVPIIKQTTLESYV